MSTFSWFAKILQIDFSCYITFVLGVLRLFASNINSLTNQETIMRI